MRIRRLLLRDFGRLRGEFHFAADRINLILEPNESGKSTLANALLAGLYGFPAGQRRSESRPVPDVEVYRPWSNGDYVVEMDVEAGGRVFTVRRDFGKKEEKVFEWRSGKEVTGEFLTAKDSLDFGGRLTGLDRDDFARSAFLRQSETREIRDAAGVTAALQRIATSQQGDVAASEAIETLRAATRQYRGRKIRRGKIEGEIAEIDEEIQTLTDRLHAMEGRRRAAESRIVELENVSGQVGLLDGDLQRLEYLVLAAGRKEDSVRLEEETQERKNLDEREKEFQSLAPSAEFPSQQLAKLLEIKGRLQEIQRESTQVKARAEEEIDHPLAALEEAATAGGALADLRPADLSRFLSAESDLTAAWKARRDARQALARQRREWRAGGVDPNRLNALAEKFVALREDDRRFLLDSGERLGALRSAAIEAEREIERIDGEIAAANDRTRRGESSRNVLAVAAAVLAIGATAIFFAPVPHLWSYMAIAAAAAALATRAALGPADATVVAPQALAAERDALARGMEERKKGAAEIEARLLSLARGAGYDSDSSFVQDYREAETHQNKTAERASLQRRLTESTAQLRQASAAIRGVMDSGGYVPRFRAITPRTARRFHALAASHRETLSRMEQMRERRRASDRQMNDLERERSAHLGDAATFLRAARVEPVDDLDEAVRRFEEGIARKDRYDALKREIIPTLVRRSLTHRGDSLKRAVEIADGVLRRRVADFPSLAGVVPEKSHKEYVEERSRVQDESRSLAERRAQLSADLGEVLREYRKECPDTLRWLGEWKEIRDRAAAFKASVDLACDVLDTLSKEAYAEWADVLNERASETLSLVSRGYDDLRFDTDLSFTVRDRSDLSRRGSDDVDHRLSAGARDQVYFSARLAMAEYLSTGRVKLPLILDDPFATFDDERFARAMELIIDRFGRRHQVILMSCHESRHRVWQEREPERFAERVRVMSLQAPVT